jgi:hypothetical protein
VGSKHRIAIASIVGRQPEIAEAAFAALVRHELEHARQWKACGDEPFELCEVAFMVYARRKAGRTTLPRGFRNHLPVEDDANAAASVFVRCERPASVAGLLDDKNFGPLARAQTRPEPPETLLARMVEFLLKYRATLAAMAETHPGDDTIEGFLRMANAPNAARIWQSLTAV